MRTRPVAAAMAGAVLAGMIVLGHSASAQEPAISGSYPYSFPTTSVPRPLTPTTPTTIPAHLLSGPRNVLAFTGLGTWIDVYDWSVTWHKKAATRTTLTDIDRMAASGVQTVFIQTGKWDSPTEVHEPQRLLPLIARAKQRGMSVVAWYLPTFENVEADLSRLVAAASIPGVDALGVDIESSRVANRTLRNQRLVELSHRLRAILPSAALAAIPYPPVVFQAINLTLWPGFPWKDIAPDYDVWMPMSYQSHRTVKSGWRDGYKYTIDNVDRVRTSIGSKVLVHAIGGIADRTSVADVNGILRASSQRGVIGGSLYDWSTTPAKLMPALRGFRNPTR